MAGAIIGSESRLDSDTVTVSPSAATGFPESNMSSDRPFLVYKPSAAGGTVDIITDAGVGNTADVDYFMIVGHDLFDPETDGNGAVTLTFARSTDGISYTTIFTQAATDNLIIPKKFVKETFRFFRLRLTRGTNFTPSVGELQWGTAVVFPFGMPVGFDPNSEEINVRANESQTGNFLGTILNFVQRKATVSVPMLDNSFVSGTSLGEFKHWWDNDGTKMKGFLWWWNPDDTFRTDAFFAIVDPGTGINRSLATQVAAGLRDLEFEILGLKE